MQFAFFSIPVDGGATVLEEMNLFLRSHRVISVQKELTQRDTAPCWRLCVEYLEGPALPPEGERRRSCVDYKEVLSEEDFSVFVRLREVRKELAGSDGIPVYAVCTNEQLAEMARRRPASINELQQIEGLGEAKCAKYGQAFLSVMVHAQGERDAEDRKPD